MTLISILKSLAALSWIGVLGVIVYAVVRITRKQKVAGGMALIAIVAVVAIVLNIVAAGLVFIEPTERGVVITIASGGVRQEELQPGLNWIIPFAENVVKYPIDRQTYTMSIASGEGQIAGDDSIEARTSDGQVVKLDISVIYAVDPEKVVDVHIKWQNQYEDKLIRPVMRGIIRDAVSQFGVEEVYSTKRLDLIEMVNSAMNESLEEGGLILVELVLRNITFSQEYSDSIERKQIAEQEAQQAAFVVEQRKQEAEQARQVAKGKADAAVLAAEGEAAALLVVAEAQAEARLIQAEAEAQALEMLAKAIAENPDVLTLEYIEKLSPNIQVMLIPADNPFLLPLPGVEDEPSPTPTYTLPPVEEGEGE
jgi:regulator of protease activity HflC (stomatin/prohibitin superfamily)